MPFIEMNLGADVQEKECAPEGEYDLVATKIEAKEYDIESESGESGKGTYLMVTHELEGVDKPYKNVYHNLWLPTQFDTEEKSYNKQLGVKRYLHAAGVPHDDSGFDPEDVVGARFTCKMGVDVDESGKYPPKNELILPQLPTS